MSVQLHRSEREEVTITRQEYDHFVSLQSKYDELSSQLSELKRLIFGSKSERFIASDDNQLGLFSENAKEKPEDPPTEQIQYTRKKKSAGKGKPTRALLADHLPRVEEIIEPEDVVPGSKKIGEVVSEILEYNPASAYVRRIVRPKYVMPASKEANNKIVIAELPTLPIPRGNAGASMLAHLQVSKWVDHLPFYRQIQILKRSGVEISSSTMNDWFNATCDLLEPLYDCHVNMVKEQIYLQADESPIKVLDGDKKKSTHTGYHWVYHAPLIKAVVFDYRKGRSREGPREFLKDYHGVLQTDGYKAYDDLFPGESSRITHIGCMAHLRRYFEKALDNDRKRAVWMLEKLQYLYEMESTMREAELTPENVLDLRQRKAVPVLEEMKAWLDKEIDQVRPKSSMGKAIAYGLRVWPKVILYIRDGNFHIDNNPIENTIRPLALGRKNYLFAGSHQAAQRAAMMYSFFGTCKLQGVNPFDWLKKVLDVIPEYKVSKLHELLPGNL